MTLAVLAEQVINLGVKLLACKRKPAIADGLNLETVLALDIIFTQVYIVK